MFDFNNDADDETEPEEQPEVPEPENEPVEETDGPEPAELDARIDDVADDVEQTRSSVRALESSQEELAESIEEVHDTVRELAGLYDRVQAAENPFVDDPGHVRADEPHDGESGNEDEPESESDAEDVVSFDDLASGGDEPEPPKTEAEPEPAKADGEPEPPNAEGEPALPESGPILASVPDGYAGDALAMEWLAGLMEQSGPAGALRAVEHYESSGWISTEVRDHLVDLVAGPDLDVFVDPMQPREPTAAEHVESGAYLRALAAL